MTIETNPLTFIDPVCGKPWIHGDHVRLVTEFCDPHGFEHLDGSPCLPGDPVRCESCGRDASPLTSDDGWKTVYSNDLLAMTDPKNWVPRKPAAGAPE